MVRDAARRRDDGCYTLTQPLLRHTGRGLLLGQARRAEVPPQAADPSLRAGGTPSPTTRRCSSRSSSASTASRRSGAPCCPTRDALELCDERIIPEHEERDEAVVARGVRARHPTQPAAVVHHDVPARAVDRRRVRPRAATDDRLRSPLPRRTICGSTRSIAVATCTRRSTRCSRSRPTTGCPYWLTHLVARNNLQLDPHEQVLHEPRASQATGLNDHRFRSILVAG